MARGNWLPGSSLSAAFVVPPIAFALRARPDPVTLTAGAALLVLTIAEAWVIVRYDVGPETLPRRAVAAVRLGAEVKVP